MASRTFLASTVLIFPSLCQSGCSSFVELKTVMGCVRERENVVRFVIENDFIGRVSLLLEARRSGILDKLLRLKRPPIVSLRVYILRVSLPVFPFSLLLWTNLYLCACINWICNVRENRGNTYYVQQFTSR